MLIFKRILFWLPFALLFLVMIIPFFQHPLADDFAGFYLSSKLGISGAIRSYLENGTGRYFVVSFFVIICSSRFLLDHYFIVPIFLFIVTYVNLFYLILTVWKVFLKNKPQIPYVHWLTAACIILFLTSIEEIATFFVWITTCCIFLLSFNLLIFYIRCFIQFNYQLQAYPGKKPGKWLYILLVVCIILLAGCEETTLYFSLLINLYIYFRKTGKKKITVFPAPLIVLQFICVAIVFLLPGNRMRTHNFSPIQPFYFSLYSALYQTAFIFFKILTNPLMWVSAGIGAFSYPLLKDHFRERIKAVKTSFFTFFLLIAGAVYFFMFFIRHFGGRVLPAYANNLVICYVIMILLVLMVSKSYLFNDRPASSVTLSKKTAGIIYLSAIFLFIFSDFTAGLIQSLATAAIHNTVLTDRKNKIAEAKAAGKMSVTFDNYQDACVRILSDKYGKKIASFVNNYYHFPPKYIYTKNAAQVDFSYAAYYGIDTIYMGTKYIVSWEKANIPYWKVK